MLAHHTDILTIVMFVFFGSWLDPEEWSRLLGSEIKQLLESSFWNLPDDVVGQRELLQTLDRSQDVKAQGSDPVIVGFESSQIRQSGQSSGWQTQDFVVTHIKIFETLKTFESVIFNLIKHTVFVSKINL